MIKLEKFIDLFCGIGGFRLALEERGLECVFSSDIDEDARKAYNANFGEFPTGDITKVDAKDVPPHDVITGGFPCQSFSLSGRQKGLDDPRGQLFYEIIRIAKHHKPKVVFLENVRHILEIDDGDVYKEFEQAWNTAGYSVRYHLLNASMYGVPQSRWRVYFVIIRHDVALQSVEPKPASDSLYICDLIEPEARDDEWLHVSENRGLQKGKGKKAIRAGRYRYQNELFVEHGRAPIKIGDIGRGGQAERIFSIHGHAPTQATWGQEYYAVDRLVRRLSQNEVKGIMGFPQSHIVGERGAGYKQLGNAVIPYMIGEVFDAIIPDTDIAYNEYNHATRRSFPDSYDRRGAQRCLSLSATSNLDPVRVTDPSVA